MQNKTVQVMINTPVRKENGRIMFRQCFPKLKYRPRVPLVGLDNLDIEQRIRHNLHLIRITRGEN